MSIPVFGSWKEIGERVRAAGRVALFLDFDGTLAPIRSRPEEVSIDPAIRSALAALARHHSRIEICIVSGRRRVDVRSRVRLPLLRCLGLYGWDDGGPTEISRDSIEALETARRRLEAHVAGRVGVWIEKKEYAFSVHYRGAPPETAAYIRDLIPAVVQSRLLRIERGKQVFEILPLELSDKGRAARRELAIHRPRPLPIYVGDDVPDEAAFAALRHGITVVVGIEHNSRARYRLHGIPQVGAFLRRLEKELR